MKRNYTMEMALRNVSLAENLTMQTVTVYDSELWRGPRLLVPIEIDALVVNPGQTAKAWANVRHRPESLEGYSTKKADYYGDEAPDENPDGDDLASPKGGRIPFDEFTGREAGVHLHWSLPDGLTQADTVCDSDEEDETEGSDVIFETEDKEITEDHEFPLIPDRWMVVRFYPGAGAASKRRVKAWVIRAEEQAPPLRVVPINTFTENRDQTQTRWLTAIGEGDPAYAAYYDNVKNTLGFYDPLDDVTHGPLTYLVAGWYSDKEGDPLYSPKTRAAWRTKLDDLGWMLGEDDEAKLASMYDATALRWAQLGLAIASDDSVSVEAFSYKTGVYASTPVMNKSLAADISMPSQTSPIQTPLSGSLSALSNMAEESPQVEIFRTGIEGLNMAEGPVYFFEDTNFRKYWPRQVLCHAMTYSVPWGNRGGNYDSLYSGPPDPLSVQVALGNTGIEALSALMADATGDPNAERIYNAYHYGMLPELQQRDGLALIESLLHAEDFESRPGGYVTETIEQGDIFHSLSSSEAGRVTLKDNPYSEKTRETYPQAKANAKAETLKTTIRSKREFSTSKKDISLVRERLEWDRRDLSTQAPNARKSIGIRRAMPRYWEPKDPVILFSQGKRSYKHGEDARRTSEDRLLCRMTGGTVTTAKVTVGFVLTQNDDQGDRVFDDVSPSQLGENLPLPGSIPPEARDLINETLFLDLDNAAIAASAFMERKNQGTLAAKFPASAYVLDNLDETVFEHRYKVQMTLDKNMVVNEELDAQVLAYFSGKEGQSPVEFAQKPWQKPWIPLHFDWEVEWMPSRNRITDWSLGEHDYEMVSPPNEGGPGLLYQGTCLMTPAITRTIHDRLTKFLADESAETQDLASDSQEFSLGDIVLAMDRLDILSGSMAGFHDYLAAQVDDFKFVPHIDEEGQPTEDKTLDSLEREKRLLANLPEYPVRAGHMRLTRLRIVDAFGQFVDIPAASIRNAIKAEDVDSGEDTPECITMPPRIISPSRLMFRMVQANQDNRDATKLNSPICGWVLPDHLDEALEFYDADGNNIGQIQRTQPIVRHHRVIVP